MNVQRSWAGGQAASQHVSAPPFAPRWHLESPAPRARCHQLSLPQILDTKDQKETKKHSTSAGSLSITYSRPAPSSARATAPLVLPG